MNQRDLGIFFAGCAVAGALSMSINGPSAVATAASGPYRGTADDFMEISQLFSRYDYNIDNGQGDGWADVFTPDGVFADPSTCAIGREQLASVAVHFGKGDSEHFHFPSMGPIVYTDRDHATVHSTVVVIGKTGMGIQGGGIFVTGSYDDTLVRSQGQWRFAYRLVHRPNNDKPAVECPAPKDRIAPHTK